MKKIILILVAGFFSLTALADLEIYKKNSDDYLLVGNNGEELSYAIFEDGEYKQIGEREYYSFSEMQRFASGQVFKNAAIGAGFFGSGLLFLTRKINLTWSYPASYVERRADGLYRVYGTVKTAMPGIILGVGLTAAAVGFEANALKFRKARELSEVNNSYEMGRLKFGQTYRLLKKLINAYDKKYPVRSEE